VQSPAAIEITMRFREAFEFVRQQNGWGTVSAFCKRNGINQNQFIATLKYPELRVLQPYWIAALCRDYGISAEWVVLGKGKMDGK
jgi:transposase-like protein